MEPWRATRPRQCRASGPGTAAVNPPFINRVPDRDVAVTVFVRRHVARGCHPGTQVRLQVLNRDEHGGLCRRLRAAGVEHVRVSVNQSRENRRAAEIDNLRTRGNGDACLRADRRDPIALQEDHLPGQQYTGQAVEQSAGADGGHARRRRALIEATIRACARRLTRASPRRS
jgi:hypothetical protein